MTQAIINLNPNQNKYITTIAKQQKLSKHESILLCIDRCIEVDITSRDSNDKEVTDTVE